MQKQLNKWIKSQNCRPIAYIGLCADEQKRFKYDIGDWKEQDVCYPLAEEGIEESVILQWARTVDLFNGWYDIFDRQGCMVCPNASRLEMAYLFKYYPEQYKWWIDKIRLYEQRFDKYFYYKPIDDMCNVIENKWLNILNNKEQYYQTNIFDFL